jgi:hypothetical protein
MNKWIILLLYFSISGLSFGQSSPYSFKYNFSSGIEIMSFDRIINFVEEVKSVNPNNEIAKLRKNELAIYFKPFLNYRCENFLLTTKPRFNVNNYKNISLYFQEFNFEYNINLRFKASIGRIVKEFGTALFINPSNPFFIDAGRVNPKIEIEPMDFIQFNYYCSNDCKIALLTNLYKGEAKIYNSPFFDFRRSYALNIDYYGHSGYLGSILSVSERGKIHLGYYGQKTINDTFLIWIDGALEYKPDRFYIIEGHEYNYLKHDVINGRRNNRIFVSDIIGISYSFTNGPTLYLEYYFNGKGYNKQDIVLQNDIFQTSNEYNFDVTKDLSNRNLGRIINNGMMYDLKNYIFSQLSQNEVFGRLNYSIRYFYSMNDCGNQLSSLIEYDLTNYLQLFSTNLINFGMSKTDFRQLINYQVMFGISVYI